MPKPCRFHGHKFYNKFDKMTQNHPKIISLSQYVFFFSFRQLGGVTVLNNEIKLAFFIKSLIFFFNFHQILQVNDILIFGQIFVDVS